MVVQIKYLQNSARLKKRDTKRAHTDEQDISKAAGQIFNGRTINEVAKELRMSAAGLLSRLNPQGVTGEIPKNNFALELIGSEALERLVREVNAGRRAITDIKDSTFVKFHADLARNYPDLDRSLVSGLMKRQPYDPTQIFLDNTSKMVKMEPGRPGRPLVSNSAETDPRC